MHLTIEQKQEIRTIYASSHITQRELAERYDVSQNTIGTIIRQPLRVCVDCGNPLGYKTRCAVCAPIHRRVLRGRYRKSDQVVSRERQRWQTNERYQEQHRKAAREYERRKAAQRRASAL